MLDVVIRGGNVVDGTGAPQRRADIGIAQGRVVAIGDDVGAAHRVVDAADRIVAPGFVDVHTHVDAQAFWDPTLGPSPLHGVTTVFGGNCGFSIAPLDSSAAAYLMQMLAIVEGMPLSALEVGVPWDWTTTEEYLDRLDGKLSINAGFMVGHSAIRRVVMGEAATERISTPEELARMQALLRAGLRAGGIGFSTTRSTNHNDANGNPVPSRFADRNELVSLAAVCREFEGTSLEYLPLDPAGSGHGRDRHRHHDRDVSPGGPPAQLERPSRQHREPRPGRGASRGGPAIAGARGQDRDAGHALAPGAGAQLRDRVRPGRLPRVGRAHGVARTGEDRPPPGPRAAPAAGPAGCQRSGQASDGELGAAADHPDVHPGHQALRGPRRGGHRGRGGERPLRRPAGHRPRRRPAHLLPPQQPGGDPGRLGSSGPRSPGIPGR